MVVASLSRGDAFFCSWSGGKDSCLALYDAIAMGGKPQQLLTMFSDQGDRSRSHGLPRRVIESQAALIGLPLIIAQASWADYESVFIEAIGRFKVDGVTHGIFGDIDLEPHREWCVKVCTKTELIAYHPLWQIPRRELLDRFLNCGFEAMVISVKQGVLDSSFLGRMLTQDVIAEFESIGIDACGENGEYHTIVTNGPLFSAPLRLTQTDQVDRDGYCFLEVDLKMNVLNS
jgi:diphthine-ammonia ligase